MHPGWLRCSGLKYRDQQAPVLTAWTAVSDDPRDRGRSSRAFERRAALGPTARAPPVSQRAPMRAPPLLTALVTLFIIAASPARAAPPSPDALGVRAEAEIAMGSFEEAATTWEALAREAPSAAVAPQALADAARRRDEARSRLCGEAAGPHHTGHARPRAAARRDRGLGRARGAREARLRHGDAAVARTRDHRHAHARLRALAGPELRGRAPAHRRAAPARDAGCRGRDGRGDLARVGRQREKGPLFEPPVDISIPPPWEERGLSSPE